MQSSSTSSAGNVVEMYYYMAYRELQYANREGGKCTTRRLPGQYFRETEEWSGPFHPSESDTRGLLYYKEEVRTGEKRGKDAPHSHGNVSRGTAYL